VSLTVDAGETLAIVGESGCGKTTLLRSIARLIEPRSGAIRLQGQDLARATRRELASLRRDLGVVFQDPQASLNPRRRIGGTLERALCARGLSRGEARLSVAGLLERVGLQAAYAARFPHELSGGERQRVGIARALAGEPPLVLLDEPVSSLDASIRRAAIELLAELQQEIGCSYVLVSHDFTTVEAVADRIAVMHQGRVVELGEARELLEHPTHPYTRELLAACPRLPGGVRSDRWADKESWPEQDDSPRMETLQPTDEATRILQSLIRFNTVNPPGDERLAIEHLHAILADAGFECELLGAVPERPNLVARLKAEGPTHTTEDPTHPTLCYLGHVDTVLADASEWTRDPWSGEIADGCVWGRGSLDMKSQVAAEVAAVARLAHEGWRPACGQLLVVAVADEETGGELGAKWLCETHPEKVRCDMLLNEGGGPSFEIGGQRFYGVCCAEKGVFRFTLTTDGAAGHASMPKLGDNALLKMAPVLKRFAERQPTLQPTAEPLAFLRGVGEDERDPHGALARLEKADPRLLRMLEPMFGVTFAPTKISASEKINVIPSKAELRVDCRVPPGLGEQEARHAIEQVLGGVEGLALEFEEALLGASGGSRSSDALRIEFTERVIGNRSPMES
jgi:ABC-type oligopeptide transport system ATPase subunit/acetylornithine deacetylase/succinyl-diaminopimelate desuccinylase-like protein